MISRLNRRWNRTARFFLVLKVPLGDGLIAFFQASFGSSSLQRNAPAAHLATPGQVEISMGRDVDAQAEVEVGGKKERPQLALL